MIKIPLDYRPTVSIVTSSVLVLGCRSGRVCTIHFGS
jgi:hypothetical protein